MISVKGQNCFQILVVKRSLNRDTWVTPVVYTETWMTGEPCGHACHSPQRTRNSVHQSWWAASPEPSPWGSIWKVCNCLCLKGHTKLLTRRWTTHILYSLRPLWNGKLFQKNYIVKGKHLLSWFQFITVTECKWKSSHRGWDGCAW